MAVSGLGYREEFVDLFYCPLHERTVIQPSIQLESPSCTG